MGALGVLLAGCQIGTRPSPPPPASATQPSAEELDAARRSLGSTAEIVFSGDLSGTGQRELLVVNRLVKPPKDTPPGLLISRAAILGKVGDHWEELFRADEYLKNARGYLAGTPLAPVNAWRLQYEREGNRWSLYFTPLQTPPGGFRTTIAVRWNSQVHRFQSLDRNLQTFLPETASLSNPPPSFRLSR